jgi:hypothetical protein
VHGDTNVMQSPVRQRSLRGDRPANPMPCPTCAGSRTLDSFLLEPMTSPACARSSTPYTVLLKPVTSPACAGSPTPYTLLLEPMTSPACSGSRTPYTFSLKTRDFPRLCRVPHTSHLSSTTRASFGLLLRQRDHDDPSMASPRTGL